MTLRLVSLLGLLLFVFIAWVLSENRWRVSWRVVVWGLGLQLVIGVLLLKTPIHEPMFSGMRSAVDVLVNSTLEGAKFVFGSLPDDFDIGAIFAFQVLPIIIFVTAISAILHHLRVVQVVVGVLAWCMRRTMKTSGAETLGVGLLIFLGIESVAHRVHSALALLQAQARIFLRIGVAHFGGDGDLFGKLGEKLGAHGVLAPFAVLDVCPF